MPENFDDGLILTNFAQSTTITMAKLRVKEICKEKGITLAFLAEKLEVSPSAVTQYLKSDNVSSATLIKLAEILGVKLDDLVIREGCNINGFVDVDGQLFRINRKEDVVSLLTFIEQKENDRSQTELQD